MNKLPFFKPGDSPRIQSASLMNGVMDAVRISRSTDYSPQSQRPRDDLPASQNTQIWVRNDSNISFESWETIGIDEPLWLFEGDSQAMAAALSDPIFSCKMPEQCRHRGRFGILTGPLGPGQVGRAVISGVTWGKITLATGSVDTAQVHMHVWYDVAEGQDNGVLGDPCYYDRIGWQSGYYAGFRYAFLEEGGSSAQALWLGLSAFDLDTIDVCPSGSMDLECRTTPHETRCGTLTEASSTAWWVTRDSCPEGCDARVDGFLPSGCTAGQVVRNVPCFNADTAKRALVRFGNLPTSETRGSCGCFARECRYTCHEVDSTWQWDVVRDNCGTGCECPDLSALEELYPGLYPCSADAVVKDVTHHCWTVEESTSTTTSSSTTTTEPPPCEGHCNYQCRHTGWGHGVDPYPTIETFWQPYGVGVDGDWCTLAAIGCGCVQYSQERFYDDENHWHAYMLDCDGNRISADCRYESIGETLQLECGPACDPPTTTTTTTSSTTTTTESTTSSTTTTDTTTTTSSTTTTTESTTSSTTSTTTTTDTTSTTTTTTTSTTTTTAAPCTGDCTFEFISGMGWGVQSTVCSDGCGCGNYYTVGNQIRYGSESGTILAIGMFNGQTYSAACE